MSMRGLSKVLYKYPLVISTPFTLHTASSQDKPWFCYSLLGIMGKTANCALPKGTFYIYRHDPRIWIFICNIQTISCSPGRPLLEAKLAGKEIFQKKRTYLNTLENTEKKIGEAFHSLLIRMIFHPNS